jgi:hypothetical protein
MLAAKMRGPTLLCVRRQNHDVGRSRSLARDIKLSTDSPTSMAESLQQLILDTLSAESLIKDTRSLIIPGQSQPAISHDAQITILGALNSLLSRDVCPMC